MFSLQRLFHHHHDIVVVMVPLDNAFHALPGDPLVGSPSAFASVRKCHAVNLRELRGVPGARWRRSNQRASRPSVSVSVPSTAPFLVLADWRTARSARRSRVDHVGIVGHLELFCFLKIGPLNRRVHLAALDKLGLVGSFDGKVLIHRLSSHAGRQRLSRFPCLLRTL